GGAEGGRPDRRPAGTGVPGGAQAGRRGAGGGVRPRPDGPAAAAGPAGPVRVVLLPDAARVEIRRQGRGAGLRQRGREGGLRAERGAAAERLRAAPRPGPCAARRGGRGGGRVPSSDRAVAGGVEVPRQRGGGDAVAEAGRAGAAVRGGGRRG